MFMEQEEKEISMIQMLKRSANNIKAIEILTDVGRYQQYLSERLNQSDKNHQNCTS